ncbi:MAG: type III-A CRISPR-associated protein Cas10/Csm1 [Anaerolineae bacterium]|nr:type III-A CRISPR-associated protein Cas10/Csm1 [Anaerolineae bacterium]
MSQDRHPGHLTELAVFFRGVEMFAQQADGAVPPALKKPTDSTVTRIAQLAEQLTRGSSVPLSDAESGPVTKPLSPILGQIALTQSVPSEAWGFKLHPLTLDDDMFPDLNTASNAQQSYANLWREFAHEIDQITTTNAVSEAGYLHTLLFLLQKYLSFVPSPLSGVPLYEFIKVTAALAACLEQGLGEAELSALSGGDPAMQNRPIAVMVRGDLSGIQSFIYRITRPATDATFRGVAKRLRGRSFYLSLLSEVVVDWLMRELGLTPANILFCGGGRFDLLIPQDATTGQQLATCLDRVQDWLLDTFYGELGLQFATCPVTPADWLDISHVYDTLEHRLSLEKTRKWQRKVGNQGFYVSAQNEYHACPVCHLSSVNDSGQICPMCDLHHKLGGKLPGAEWLAFVYERIALPHDAAAARFELFSTTAVLLDDKERVELLKTTTPFQAVFYRLNDTTFLTSSNSPGVGLGFRFLANTAPVALNKITMDDPRAEPIYRGEVLDFDQIAELSAGAKRLGVLKADVDHLGLIFGEGLKPLTVARYATLSGAMERFFSGWLNRLCDRLFDDWQKDAGNQHSWRDQVSNMFYVLYAGGDDLFIVGPWDQTLELASRLQADFEQYACRNANVTLSAGVVQVKPHYPAQRFALLVSERLENAKRADRKRIDVFDHVALWKSEDGLPGFADLLAYARLLHKHVGENSLPRTFVHYLGRLYWQHFAIPEEQRKFPPKFTLMFLPKLYYAIKRRVSAEADRDLNLAHHLWTKKMMWHAPILVSYVSLITRKE